jgi:hypothetical protein
MYNENEYGPYYEKYREFWQGNLQVLNDLSASLEKTIVELEAKYFDFDIIYDKLVQQLDILSSLYSSYNSLSGHDYILKLKALIADYKKRYTHEGIDFNLLHFLHAKAIELREQQFNEFPRLEHAGRVLDAHVPAPATDPGDLPFKWICFERNDSWFIVPYVHLDRIEYRAAEIIPGGPGAPFRVRVHGNELPVIDLFATVSASVHTPGSFIILDDARRRLAFAATKIGRRIGARRDFLKDLIKARRGSGPVTGSVRIFGVSHLHIDTTRVG